MSGLKSNRILFALVVLAVLASCDRGLPVDTAAEAAEFQLSVEDAAQILAPISALPNEPGVAETTLDFWIDYALLAWAVNQDGALEELDISAILEQESTRLLVVQLRDEVIQVDTAITDEEMQSAFDEQRPGEEVRARHILLSIPPGATGPQQDSLRALAEDLRDRVRAGEDFGGMAAEYSQDPGSAAQGGDLGFFGRGAMVAPFEEGAFALRPGETSDVIQSDFGLHVIRLEERRGPSLEEIAAEFRVQMQAERTMVAESTYLAQIEGPANVRLGDDAVELVRQITDAPSESLSGGDASTALTIWEGGELPAADYLEFLTAQPGAVQRQISLAQDDQLETMLRDLSRDRILMAEAGRRGIELTAEDEETITTDILSQYLLAANFLGLDSLEVEEGASLVDRVDQEILDLMNRLVANEQDIVPLGPLAPPLRARYRQRVGEEAVERIVARVEELRNEGARAVPQSGELEPDPGTPGTPGTEPAGQP